MNYLDERDYSEEAANARILEEEQDEAYSAPEAVVRPVSDEALIEALIVLTHRIHGTTGPHADRLREECDVLRAEILHRMGGTR